MISKYQSVTSWGQSPSLRPGTFGLEQELFMHFLTWWLNLLTFWFGLAIMNTEDKLWIINCTWIYPSNSGCFTQCLKLFSLTLQMPCVAYHTSLYKISGNPFDILLNMLDMLGRKTYSRDKTISSGRYLIITKKKKIKMKQMENWSDASRYLYTRG